MKDCKYCRYDKFGNGGSILENGDGKLDVSQTEDGMLQLWKEDRTIAEVPTHYCFNCGRELKYINKKEQTTKEDYSLPPEHSMYDTCYCNADCVTNCARRKEPKGFYSCSDFTKTCSKFKQA